MRISMTPIFFSISINSHLKREDSLSHKLDKLERSFAELSYGWDGKEEEKEEEEEEGEGGEGEMEEEDWGSEADIEIGHLR